MFYGNVKEVFFGFEKEEFIPSQKVEKYFKIVCLVGDGRRRKLFHSFKVNQIILM
jgi:hypothetical protein